MKTKMIFLLLAWTGAVLTLPAQTGRPVSAELKGVPLSAALKKLEQASGCSILFTYSDVQPYRVTASIRDMAVEQAVKKLLEGKPLTSVRRGEEYLIVLPDSVHRLPVAVRGRVTDEADRPLPYSNVLLLTPDSVFVNGCVSREDGSFLMTAEEGKAYLLKVSSVGYATVVQAAAAGNRIRLAPDAQMLEEVTVTGRRRLIEPSAGGVKANVAGTSLARMGTPGGTLGTALQRSWGETVTSCNGTEAERADFVMRSCPRDGINHAVNAYYVGEAGRWTLDLNADYLDNRMKSSQYAEDGSGADISSVSDSESRLYAARLQAGVKLGKGQLSFGSEGTLTERKDLFTQSGFSADADNFIRQRAFAVFAGYSASWGKWRANAGLRYEHRATDYWDQGVRVEEQSPVYDELIPTVSVSWSDRDLSLALAWKTMRTNPSYALLTNAVSYRTQYSYTTGNPGLEPSQASILSLNLAYKWLFAYVQYSYSRNSLSNITMPYNEETHPGVLLFTSANLAPGSGCIINLSAAPRIGVWQPQFSITGVYAAPDGRNLGIEVWRRQPLFNFGWDNSFTLPQGWFLNVQGSLQTAARMGFMVNRLEGRLNARVSKSFLKDDALTLSLTADDILRTGYYHFNVYGIDSYNGNRIYRDWQRVGIQLSYKFNATKSKYKGTGAGQSEKARL